MPAHFLQNISCDIIKISHIDHESDAQLLPMQQTYLLLAAGGSKGTIRVDTLLASSCAAGVAGVDGTESSRFRDSSSRFSVRVYSFSLSLSLREPQGSGRLWWAGSSSSRTDDICPLPTINRNITQPKQLRSWSEQQNVDPITSQVAPQENHRDSR